MLYQDYDHANMAERDDVPAADAAAHADPQAAASQQKQPGQPTATTTAAAAPAPGPTASASAVTPLQPPPPPSQTSAPASQVATAHLSIPGRAVVAKPAVAQDEPVLLGKLVSAESSAVRSAGPQSWSRKQDRGKGEEGGEEDAAPLHSDSLSSSSTATSDAFVGDPDKTEIIYDFGRYVGQVDPLTGLRDGEGCLHYKSGNVYTGSWRDGAADGFGEKRYKNGDIFRGHWSQGKRSGRGAYLFAQGHFYDGMYVNDQPDGYGIYTTLKGDRYAGHWKAGHKNGKGRETLANGQVFVGNWRNGKKQGRGKLYLPGAKGYIFGIWNNDKFFRELTEAEMGLDGKEDVVDEFGLPRDPSAPPVTPPWRKPAPTGAGMTDRVLMGVTALEDRMESLGRALERVIGGSNTAEAAFDTDSTVAGAGPNARAAVTADDPASSQLRFASPDWETADGILVGAMEGEEEEGGPAEVELYRPVRAANEVPPAAVLSTAVGVDYQPVENNNSSTATFAAAAEHTPEGSTMQS